MESYDDLERMMLRDFFDFMRSQHNAKWVHWNMRDINYGFPAIEHRFSALGGDPYVLPDNVKTDLARVMVDLYGRRYIGHPRLLKLVELNNITKRDFLNGEQEALAFQRCEWVKLHQSTLRKVDILATVLERAHEGSLKTNAKWRERYGFSVGGIYDAVTESPLWLILTILSIPTGLIASVVAFLSGWWS